MKCLKCGVEGLLGILTITKTLVVVKGGSVNVAGEKVTQADMKVIWDKDHTGEEDRIIRGPMVCPECETPHYYIKGASPTLRLGSYKDACQKGVEALLSGEGEESNPQDVDEDDADCD